MKKSWKQWMAIACVFAMIACLLPAGILADEGQDAAPEQVPVTEPAQVLSEEPAEVPAEEPAADPDAEPEAEPADEPAAEAEGEPVAEPAAEEPAERHSIREPPSLRKRSSPAAASCRLLKEPRPQVP